MTMTHDIVVIGSGPGGYKAAVTAAHLGAKVALIEKDLPGGTCLNQGCVPKNALLHLASLIEDVSSLQGRGLAGQVKGDFAGALAHRDSVVSGIRENFPFWLRRLGIALHFGEARLISRDAVEITSAGKRETIRAGKIIVATGAAPREHHACPTDGDVIINSRHFMFDMKRLPASVLFIGGGAIGTELAFLMHQFGARVTIAECAERLLDKPGISERASGALERKFARLGIDVHKGVTIEGCRKTENGARVQLSDGSDEEYASIFVAIGRQPMSAHLNLPELGVKLDDEGFIETDDYLETTVPGIYAIGDVKRGPMTANGALHDAKIAATNAVEGNQVRANYKLVPIVVDSALEIAAVGLTEEQAENAGFEPDVARASFGGSAKARARNDYEGFIEVVHDGETGQLLGGCIVGPEAGEQIHMMAAACQSERGLWFFTDMNYSHPSWTEELETAIDPHTFAFTRSARSGKAIFQPGIYSRGK